MQPLQFILLTAAGWTISGVVYSHLLSTPIAYLHTLHAATCFFVGVICYLCGRDSRR